MSRAGATRWRASPRAQQRALRAATLALGVAPGVALVAAALNGGLGANPVEKVTHETGQWALRLLLLSLSVTPLRRLTGWRAIVRERRTLGLFAFAYACLHFCIYLVLDLELDFSHLGEDILERPWITVGFTTFVMLATLAATSTRAAARRLGRRWKSLHRLAYAAGIGAVVHFLWLVKADLREPLIYAAVLAGLLGVRLWWSLQARLRAPAAAG